MERRVPKWSSGLRAEPGVLWQCCDFVSDGPFAVSARVLCGLLGMAQATRSTTP